MATSEAKQPEQDVLAVPWPLVFVVDDEESIREAYSAILEMEGFRAEGMDADTALHRLAEDWPAALVLDLRMWPVDGLELLERVMLTYRRIPPSILVTAYMITGRTQVLTDRAAVLGAVRVLTKPVDAEALVTAVRAALAEGDAAV